MNIEVRASRRVMARAVVARGCFANLRLENDVGAARELFARIVDWQLAQGESGCVGPVSLAPSRLGEGVRIYGFDRRDRLSPAQPSYYARLMDACGAESVRRDWLYEIPLPDNRADFKRMAARFGASAAGGRANRALCEQVAEVAGVSPRQMAQVFGSLPDPFIAVAHVRGALAGYMIVLPNGRARRIAEARVLPAYHRRGAIAALVDAVWPRLGSVAEAGVIDEKNRASALLAERAGGKKVAGFSLYRLTKI